MTTANRGHAGFTLIEAVLTCALVGLLVAMLLPSIADVRHRARRTVSTSNLRSHAQVLSIYVGDWKDVFPYFATPGAHRSVVRNPSRGVALLIPYFGSHFTWHVALAEGYYDGDHTSRAFRPPGREDVAPGWNAYWYPCSFIASPAFWRPETREGPHQWVPTRADQVVFSAAKVLLVESDVVREGGHVSLRPTVHAATTDGGAAERSSTLVHGLSYGGGDGPWNGAMHGTWAPTVHHTIGGVAGRDFR